jgi:hypothetical protein
MPSISHILYLNKSYQRFAQISDALDLRQTMYKSKLQSKVGTPLPSLRQAERPTSANYHANASTHGTRSEMKFVRE